MPRFHFRMRDGAVDLDSEGTECADFEVAKTEAVRYLGECIQDSPSDIVADGQLEVEVADAAGQALFLVRLTCQLTPSAVDRPGKDNDHD